MVLEGRFGFRRTGYTVLLQQGWRMAWSSVLLWSGWHSPFPPCTHALIVQDADPMPGWSCAGSGAGRRRSLHQGLFAVWGCAGAAAAWSGSLPVSTTAMQRCSHRDGSGGCRCWFCSGEDPGDVHGAGSLWVGDHRPQQQLHALLHGPVAGFQCHRPDNGCSPPGTPWTSLPGETGGLWLNPGSLGWGRQ